MTDPITEVVLSCKRCGSAVPTPIPIVSDPPVCNDCQQRDVTSLLVGSALIGLLTAIGPPAPMSDDLRKRIARYKIRPKKRPKNRNRNRRRRLSQRKR